MLLFPDFYKGKGGTKLGLHTNKGGYVMQSHKAPRIAVPDLTGFSVCAMLYKGLSLDLAGASASNVRRVVAELLFLCTSLLATLAGLHSSSLTWRYAHLK